MRVLFFVSALIYLSVTVFGQAFDENQLETKLSLTFSKGNVDMFSADGQSTQQLVNGIDGATSVNDNGLFISPENPGYFYVSQPELRHSTEFARIDNNKLPVNSQGNIFHSVINFGSAQSNVCTFCDTPAFGRTCPKDVTADNILVEDSTLKAPDVIFSLPVVGYAKNFLFLFQRHRSSATDINSPNVNCSPDRLLYTFMVQVGDTMVATWKVYAWHGVWLDDAKDHSITLTFPRDFITTKDDDRHWPLLYIDGQYICLASDQFAAMASIQSPVYCSDTFVDTTNSKPGVPKAKGEAGKPFSDREVPSVNCPANRLFLGNAPLTWVVPNGLALSGFFGGFENKHALLGATYKQFSIFAYVGVPQPAEPFLCTSTKTCTAYFNNPWCLKTDSGTGEFEVIGIKPPVGPCPKPVCECGTLNTDNQCSACGVKCLAGFKCCNFQCVPLDQCCSTCGADEVCCNGECSSLLADKTCNTCSQDCTKKGQSCCPPPNAAVVHRGQACSGTKFHCTACGNDCTKVVAATADCCGNQCVDLAKGVDKVVDSVTVKTNCGACDSTCNKTIPFCCSGICTDMRSNIDCGSCGNKCGVGANVGKTKCCNGACSTLDTDTQCGSCENDCVKLGLKLGKTLGCCKGVCLEVGKTVTNCGTCGLNCEQVFEKELAADKDAKALCCNGKCGVTGSAAVCGACGDPECVPDPDGKNKNTCCKNGVNRVCADLLTATDNCGTCGTKCAAPNPFCCGGKCGPNLCSDGQGPLPETPAGGAPTPAPAQP